MSEENKVRFGLSNVHVGTVTLSDGTPSFSIPKKYPGAVKLTMEEFYAQAADADYLIYNSSIDNPINSVKDLEEKDALFSDFKAVKEGNVWCTGKYLYQATDIVGELITDMNLMLTGGDESKMTFLYHVK